MKNRRLEHLRNRYKDTYNAVLWLRANQHKFHAPIHEPILLQASCAPIKLDQEGPLHHLLSTLFYKELHVIQALYSLQR